MQRSGLAIATVLVLSFLLSIHLLPGRVSLKLGDIAPETIYAHRTARYEDTAETALRMKQAAQIVAPVYISVPGAEKQATQSIKMLLGAVKNVKANYPGLSVSQSVSRLRGMLSDSSGLSDDVLKLLVKSDAAAIDDLQEQSIRLVTLAMDKPLHNDSSEMRAVRKNVADTAKRVLGSRSTARLAGDIAAFVIVPNKI